MNKYLFFIFVIISFNSAYLNALELKDSESQFNSIKKAEKNNYNGFENMGTCKNYIEAEIYGLVCDFCARSIEKTFKKMDNVESIDINLENGIVKIFLKKGKTIKNSIIKQNFISSGYETNKIVKNCD